MSNSYPQNRGRFSSKRDAQNKRKHLWGCIRCDATYTEKRKTCDQCQHPVQYFPSQAEFRRFAALRLEQRFGHISDLELQPSYTIVLNGKQVCTYRADFKYTRDGQRVVEDVKGTTNEKYLDDVFKLKRKLVEAVHGITINIVKG